MATQQADAHAGASGIKYPIGARARFRIDTHASDRPRPEPESDPIAYPSPFELNTEGLDMVYITPPTLVYQVASSTEQVSLQNNEVRRVEYGVCSSLSAIEPNGVLDKWQTNANSLAPIMYAVDLLSKSKRHELENSKAADIFRWSESWAASLKISIIRPPAHAQLGDLKTNRSLPIVPNTGYLGKDRVDVLVEGKDDLGRPFKLTLRYYLTVLNKSEEQRIYGGKDLPFKELCGKNHNRWTISELSESGNIALGMGNLAAWQRSTALSAPIASAQKSLTGLTDLPTVALGKSCNQGFNACE